MTREEAKDWIEALISTMKEETRGNYPDPEYSDEVYEALDMTIKSLEQEPCEDCVSREEAKQFLYERIDRLNDDELYDIFSRIIDDMYNELPSVTPKPKAGHWINAKVGKLFPSNDFKCSECGNVLDFNGVNCGRGDANYCPNCGAKMQEVKE